jgi:hypothetical protein
MKRVFIFMLLSFVGVLSIFASPVAQKDLKKYSEYKVLCIGQENSILYFETIAYPVFKKFKTATGYDSTILNKVYFERDFLVYDISMLKIDSAGNSKVNSNILIYFSIDNKNKKVYLIKTVSKENGHIEEDPLMLSMFLGLYPALMQ